MNLSNLLKKTFIDSQIYVSLVGTLMATFFMLEQNTFRFPCFFLIFITYICGYLYTKYQNTKYLYPILGISAISGLVCIYIIIENKNSIRVVHWLIIVLLGLLYNSRFLNFNIRKIPLLKIFYVAFIWGLMNAWLTHPTPNFPIFWISFFWISALILPFDIRDMNQDHIMTFPKLIGIPKTKILSILFLLSACALSLIWLDKPYSTAMLISTGIAIPVILFTTPQRSSSYFTIVVETCSALPFLILILLEYF